MAWTPSASAWATGSTAGIVIHAAAAVGSISATAEAVYEDLARLEGKHGGITRYEDLPANARSYLERLQALVGVPITIISTGPDREQTIIRQNPFG